MPKQEFVQAHFYTQKGLVLNPQNEALLRYQTYTAFFQDTEQDNKKAFTSVINLIKKRPDFRNQVLFDLENLEKAGVSTEKINALRRKLNL